MKINQKHTKLYFEHFDIPPDPSVFVVCELSGRRAADIHHIDARGMGGRPDAEDIENLIALSLELHKRYGDIKSYKSWLKMEHTRFLYEFKASGKDYEEFIQTYKFPPQ